MTGFKILCCAAIASVAVPGAGMADDDLLRLLIRGIHTGPVYHVHRDDDDDDDGFRGRYVRGDYGYYRYGGRVQRDDDDDDGGRRRHDDDDDD